MSETQTLIEPPIDIDHAQAPDRQGGPVPEMPRGKCTAMIVVHGIGQQQPFETLDAVARAIGERHLQEGAGGGARSVAQVMRFVRARGSDKLHPRVEMTLKEDGKEERCVHLYEAYWAPLTEGTISYTQTASQLLKAGWRGLRDAGRRRFTRWMFGRELALPVDRGTWQLLGIALALLAPLLFGLMGVGGLSLALSRRVGQAMAGQGTLWLGAVGLAVALWLAAKARRRVVQFLGDVIVYVSGHEINSLFRVRDEIKAVGRTLATLVYGALEKGDPGQPQRLLYSDVVVVGHSLGSVVAYDTLNGMINQDALNNRRWRVTQRTHALVTLGSPLDKVVFLFRMKAKDALLRDALASAYQPLILDYENRPAWWVNVFCGWDPVSGSLEYFDDPDRLPQEPKRVRNFADPSFSLNPISAHTKYWNRSVSRDFLYHAACGSIDVAAARHQEHFREVRRV